MNNETVPPFCILQMPQSDENAAMLFMLNVKKKLKMQTVRLLLLLYKLERSILIFSIPMTPFWVMGEAGVRPG